MYAGGKRKEGNKKRKEIYDRLGRLHTTLVMTTRPTSFVNAALQTRRRSRHASRTGYSKYSTRAFPTPFQKVPIPQPSVQSQIPTTTPCSRLLYDEGALSDHPRLPMAFADCRFLKGGGSKIFSQTPSHATESPVRLSVPRRRKRHRARQSGRRAL